MINFINHLCTFVCCFFFVYIKFTSFFSSTMPQTKGKQMFFWGKKNKQHKNVFVASFSSIFISFNQSPIIFYSFHFSFFHTTIAFRHCNKIAKTSSFLHRKTIFLLLRQSVIPMYLSLKLCWFLFINATAAVVAARCWILFFFLFLYESKMRTTKTFEQDSDKRIFQLENGKNGVFR